MDGQDHLLIFGASARAAAFSALRAGLRPWCADLFGDEDLLGRCPVVYVPGRDYPQGFLELAGGQVRGPWLYTGGLENRPALVRRLANLRPLWGNDGEALRHVRSPFFVAALLNEAGLPHPAVRGCLDEPPRAGQWLVKPLKGAGGSGIRPWTGPPLAAPGHGRNYLQEYVEGLPCAALYVGDGRRAPLLGVTRQLVGESWLHAGPFHYCGSVGPLELTSAQQRAFERLGTVLAGGCGLRGLFGVDCLLRDDVPWPVEVNPRYTASVEVLEYATGRPALALHRKVFDPAASASPSGWRRSPLPVLGKAILFARRPLTFPEDGPWRPVLEAPGRPEELPAFADIPRAGLHIEAGRPILSLFARAMTQAACLAALQQVAAALDRELFGRYYPGN